MGIVNSRFFSGIKNYRDINATIGDVLILNNDVALQIKAQPSMEKKKATVLMLNENKNQSWRFVTNLQLYKKLCHFSLNEFTDTFGVDNINNNLKIFSNKITDRFIVIYNLTSLLKRQRLSIVCTWDTTKFLESITSVFRGSNWAEREVWDMFGIFFTKHNNLRRILTDYGFSGFPLRKDFPVTGYFEVRYDEEIKTVVYDKITLAQENRTYDLPTPWRGYNSN